MGRDQEKLSSFIQHRSPGGSGRLNAQSQETQTPFSDNRRRHSEGSLNQERGKKMRQQVEDNNSARAAAESAGSKDELSFSKRQDLAPDQAGITGPSDQAKGQDNVVQSGP